MEMIKASRCSLDETYYLTGMWWDYIGNRSLINEPVKLIEVRTDKWIERAMFNFTKRRQEKRWLFQSLNNPNLIVSASGREKLFKEKYNVNTRSACC
jgi:hypothetical protein